MGKACAIRRGRTAVLAVILTGGTASAAIINIPPVEVVILQHDYFFDNIFQETIIRDAVQFPCDPCDCVGPGFTAAIANGDTIITRFEAPAGKKFVVTLNTTGANQFFVVVAFWHTGASDTGSNFVPGTVTFENFSGTLPVNTFTQNGAFDNGEAIKVIEQFSVNGSFEFTAMQVVFIVRPPLMPVKKTYMPVDSSSAPSFGSSAVLVGHAPDQTIMQIVSLTCPEDLDGDSMVGIIDFLMLLAAWGPNPGHPADIDGDGSVGIVDLLLLLASWGPCK